MGDKAAHPKVTVAPSSQHLLEIENEAEQQRDPLLSSATIRRAQINPRSLSPGEVIRLQRTVGNRAVRRMLAGRETPPVAELSPRQPLPTIQRAPVAPATPRPGVRRDAGVIQRAMGVISNKTSARVVTNPLNGTPKQQIRQIDKSTKGQKYKRFDSVEIDDDDTLHIRDEEGNVVWYRVAGAPNTYIQVAKTFFVKPKAGKKSDVELDKEGLGEMLDIGGGLLNTVDDQLIGANRGRDVEEAKGKELTDSETTTYKDTALAEGAFWIGGSGVGVLSGILGMASSLKELTSNESTAWDKVEAAFNLIASGSDTVGSLSGVAGGISSLVSTGLDDESSVAETAGSISSWTFGYQSMFGSISSGVKTILGVVNLVKMIAESIKDRHEHNTEEWLEQAAGLVTNALETAKGVFMTVRIIYETVKDVVTTAFENVIPGLDIAISAVKTIFQGYYLVKSAWRWIKMLWRGRSLKKELRGQGYDKSEIKEARKFYSKRESEIANVEHQKRRAQKQIDKRNKKIMNMPITGSQKTLEKRLNKMYALSDEVGELEDKNRGLGTRKDEIKEQIVDYENERLEDEEGQGEGEEEGEEEDAKRWAHPSRMDLSELELSSELGAANRKRVVRQAVHIASNLIRIAGSIVVIVGGQGAPAGLALKAIGAGVDISLPFFRSIKQFGRNVAAKNQTKGEKGISGHIFNPNKSTPAKLANRKKQAVAILMMVANLNKLAPKSNDPDERKEELKTLKAAAERVEGYIEVAGCTPRKLYKHNGNPGKQVAILVKAMSKREFGFG